MDGSILEVRENRLDDIRDLAALHGMSRSIEYFTRMFFEPEIFRQISDKVRGYYLLSKDRTAGCFQCYYYTRLFYRQTPIVGRSECFLGSSKEFSAYLFSLLDKIDAQTIPCVCYANTIANEKSFALATRYRGMNPGPARCKYISTGYPAVMLKWLAKDIYPWKLSKRIRLLVALWPVIVVLNAIGQIVKRPFEERAGYKFIKRVDIDDQLFGEFWQRFLESNDGLVSSRKPSTLRWMFGEALKKDVDVLLAAEKDGRMDGYVLLRKYLLPGSSFCWRYKIIDICAVKNGYTCLRVLVKAAMRYAAMHKGIRVQYIGGHHGQEVWLDPILTDKAELKANSTAWRSRDCGIEETLNQNQKGWFFGPFDGERCFGHMGYVDV